MGRERRTGEQDSLGKVAANHGFLGGSPVGRTQRSSCLGHLVDGTAGFPARARWLAKWSRHSTKKEFPAMSWMAMS